VVGLRGGLMGIRWVASLLAGMVEGLGDRGWRTQPESVTKDPSGNFAPEMPTGGRVASDLRMGEKDAGNVGNSTRAHCHKKYHRNGISGCDFWNCLWIVTIMQAKRASLSSGQCWT